MDSLLLPACDLLQGLQDTLTKCEIDYKKEIEELGQVALAEERANGRIFDLKEHISALLASQLSSQRPWKPIAENERGLQEIFLNYDPIALREADPDLLEAKLCAIRCGNRRIRKQLRALKQNITTLERIERDFGSLDAFITSDDPDRIATQLSEPGPYKLKEVGYPLALEYMKNVGICAGKPDVHVRRVLGPHRLSFFDHEPDERQAYELIAILASESRCNQTYLDNILWIFCAKDYGEICGAKPRCEICALSGHCRYPMTRMSVSTNGKKEAESGQSCP